MKTNNINSAAAATATLTTKKVIMNSKLNSPSSNNSQTESETSETPSVEENTQKTSASQKVTKNWKKLKENERPPWKGVSVSTLPKPDKEALMKAKLLDARLRDKKASTLVQTDEVLIKVTKDGDTMVGNDLILMEDKANTTDGSIMLTENTGQFILKQTVSLMTEGILVKDVETQTDLPLPDCVYSFLKDNPMRFNRYYYNLDAVSQEEAESEKHLRKIRETRRDLRQFQKTKKRREKHKNLSDDSLSSDEDNYLNPKSKMKNKIPNTMSQWYLPPEETNIQPYTYITSRPSGTMPKDTSSIRDMNLSPHFKRRPPTCKCQCQCGRIQKPEDPKVGSESTTLLHELEALRISKSKWKNDPEFQFAYGKEVDRLSEKYKSELKRLNEKEKYFEELERKIKSPPNQIKHFEYLEVKKDED